MDNPGFRPSVRKLGAASPVGAEAVLVVDMSPKADGASLTDVVSRALPNHPIVRIDPVTDLVGYQGLVPMKVLVSEYATAIRTLDLKPTRLVAHCQAVGFAMALTDELGSVAELRSIVLDPVWPAFISVEAELQTLRLAMEIGTPDPVSLPIDPAGALDEVRRIIYADLDAVVRAQGLDGEIAEFLKAQLGERYLGWMAYAVAAAGFDGPMARADLAVVIDDAESARSGQTGSTIVVPAPRSAFLTDSRVASAIANFARMA